VPWTKILDEVEKARQFEKSRALATHLDPISSEALVAVPGSERRRIATLRVARTLATLDYSERIRGPHLDQAMEWTSRNFEKMRRWDFERGPDFDIEKFQR
jgi:hypothetical protein